MNKTYNHANLCDTHPPSQKILKNVYSERMPFRMLTKPTRRYLKSLELDFIHCPDCEAQSIIFNGYDHKGTQRFKCKGCNYQFVAQYDAIFPRSKRREIFEEEFLANIKPTGFDKTGTGRKCYWRGALLGTLQMLESQSIKVRANRMIKMHPVRSQKDYRAVLEFLVHEAYLFAAEA